MASKRHLVSTGFQGTSTTNPFNDLTEIEDIENAAIAKIEIRHSHYINSFRVHYCGQEPAPQRGIPGGTLSVIDLKPGEIITKIQGRIFKGQVSILTGLIFYDNMDREWGPYGGQRGVKFDWEAKVAGRSDSMALLYFSGSWGSLLGQLQATFVGSPVVTDIRDPPSEMKYERRTREQAPIQGQRNLSRFAGCLMSPLVKLVVGVERVEFHAYKNVLCQLDYFRAALQGGFREASDQIINIPEDEPEIIAALIEYLSVGHYTYSYDPEEISVGVEQIPICTPLEGSYHVGVYAAASKYGCKPLINTATSSIKYAMKNLSPIEVVQLMRELYEMGFDAAPWEKDDDMQEFGQKLPSLLKGLYITNPEEMKVMVEGCPAMANHLIRLLVSTS